MDKEKFIDMIIDEILSGDIEDLRKLFFTISKDELQRRVLYEGYDLFIDFKEIITEHYGKEEEINMTLILISKIYDRIKWLN